MIIIAKIVQKEIIEYTEFCRLFVYICKVSSRNDITMKKILNEQLYITDSNPIKARHYDYACFTYPWHFHKEFELLYAEHGGGDCLVGDNIIRYSNEHLFLFGPELPHCIHNDKKDKNGNLLRVNGSIIQFEKDFMQYSFSHYLQFSQINRLLQEAERGILFSLKKRPAIQEMLISLPQTEGVKQIILFIELLHELSTVHTRTLVASPNYYKNPSVFKNNKIEKVLTYLNKQYTHPITLEEVSSFAAMNPTAFCRFFKESTGKTFKQYILEMRIGYACKLLMNSRLSITDVSMECGFESIVHFNRSFKRFTGVTPTLYKNKTI